MPSIYEFSKLNKIVLLSFSKITLLQENVNDTVAKNMNFLFDSSRCSLFWLATIELYLFIQNMLTPMGDHIIWKLRFESSGRNAGFSWKSRTRYLKRSSEKRCLSGLRHCSFRSSNRRNAVRASPKTAPDLPRIASLLIRGGVLFILQEC